MPDLLNRMQRRWQNYRLISLTSHFRIVMEWTVRCKLIAFLKKGLPRLHQAQFSATNELPHPVSTALWLGIEAVTQ